MFLSLRFLFNTVLAEQGSEEEALRVFFFNRDTGKGQEKGPLQ